MRPTFSSLLSLLFLSFTVVHGGILSSRSDLAEDYDYIIVGGEFKHAYNQLHQSLMQPFLRWYRWQRAR
jgi:hypothetical protein